MSRKVVATGMGMVSSLGSGIKLNWTNGVLDMKCGIVRLD